MCGIVGYIGSRDAASVVVGGLRRLEYRGYDSAGIAVLYENGDISVERAVGKLRNLEEKLGPTCLGCQIAIGHTRWATHGGVTEQNAHPHVGARSRVAVVHNGIIENYAALRQELTSAGVTFASETDSEVVAHLVERELEPRGDLLAAVHRVLPRIQGASSFVFISPDSPDCLVAARLGNAGGIVVGLGTEESFVASDIPAILEHTREVLFLEHRQTALVTRGGVEIFTGPRAGYALQHSLGSRCCWRALPPLHLKRSRSNRTQLPTPFGVARTSTCLASGGDSAAHGCRKARSLQKIIIAACGTSYHAELIRSSCWRTLPASVEVDYASEVSLPQSLSRFGYGVLAAQSAKRWILLPR